MLGLFCGQIHQRDFLARNHLVKRFCRRSRALRLRCRVVVVGEHNRLIFGRELFPCIIGGNKRVRTALPDSFRGDIPRQYFGIARQNLPARKRRVVLNRKQLQSNRAERAVDGLFLGNRRSAVRRVAVKLHCRGEALAVGVLALVLAHTVVLRAKRVYKQLQRGLVKRKIGYANVLSVTSYNKLVRKRAFVARYKLHRQNIRIIPADNLFLGAYSQPVAHKRDTARAVKCGRCVRKAKRFLCGRKIGVPAEALLRADLRAEGVNQFLKAHSFFLPPLKGCA